MQRGAGRDQAAVAENRGSEEDTAATGWGCSQKAVPFTKTKKRKKRNKRVTAKATARGGRLGVAAYGPTRKIKPEDNCTIR